MIEIKLWDKSNGSDEVADSLFEILVEIYGVSPWSKSQLLADWQLQQSAYWLVIVAGKVCGFLATQDLGGEIEITQLAILPRYQGQGLASRLLAEVIRKEQPIFLEVRVSNLPAQALYQKLGFEKIGQRKAYYHGPVEDALILRREGNDER